MCTCVIVLYIYIYLGVLTCLNAKPLANDSYVSLKMEETLALSTIY